MANQKSSPSMGDLARAAADIGRGLATGNAADLAVSTAVHFKTILYSITILIFTFVILPVMIIMSLPSLVVNAWALSDDGNLLNVMESIDSQVLENLKRSFDYTFGNIEIDYLQYQNDHDCNYKDCEISYTFSNLAEGEEKPNFETVCSPDIPMLVSMYSIYIAELDDDVDSENIKDHLAGLTDFILQNKAKFFLFERDETIEADEDSEIVSLEYKVKYVGEDVIGREIFSLTPDDIVLAEAQANNLREQLFAEQYDRLTAVDDSNISEIVAIKALTLSDPAIKSSTKLDNVPLDIENYKGNMTSRFGDRRNVLSVKDIHTGIDIAAPKGTDIYCVGDGKVIKVGNESGGYGNYIIVQHTPVIFTLYAHCSRIVASEGQTVSSGQVIAKVGSTGRSTGNHLHLSVMTLKNKAMNYVNPFNYLVN